MNILNWNASHTDLFNASLIHKMTKSVIEMHNEVPDSNSTKIHSRME